MDKYDWLKNLYDDLQIVNEASFPKKCSNCGKRYNNINEYINNTNAIRNNTGLKASWDEEENTIVELFRNCSCGSTIMEFFKDRRNSSRRGDNRRELFQTFLDVLTSKGISLEVARVELLKVIHGEESNIIDLFSAELKRNIRA